MAQQNLKINITGDSSKLTSALNSASSKLSRFGSKMQSVGSQLQTKLALPLALAGGAAVKMALDFDKSMTQIKSLVGLAGDEVDKMGKSVKKMALITGKSSGEAAEALFFITSAGLRGKEAMDVLEMSLKAAAVGLGETKTIADLSTSAMNAYGSETLSASDATDILTAAVREGKLEASQLAGAMGGVIPLASNMGVSFDQVGAAMAAMSKTGTDAATGATQLTAILATLKKPSAQAKEALANMGMSIEFVQQSLRVDGLLQTLIMLQDGLKKTGQDTTALFPNIRALKGVLDLTGAGVEDNRRLFDSLTQSMGATKNAFDETSKSASFRFQQAFNQAKETLTSLGQQILVQIVPVIQKLSNIVRSLYKAFKDLSPVTQKIVVGLGIFATALPTLISLFGTLTTVVGAFLSPIGLVAGALAAVAYIIYKNWNEILPVVVGLYNQFVDLYNSSALLRGAIFGIKTAFASVFIAAKAQVDQVVNSFKTMWELVKEFSEKGVKGSFGDILTKGFNQSIQITTQAGEDIGNAFSDSLSDAIGSQLEKKTTEQVQTSLSNIASDVQNYIGSLSSIFQGGGVGVDTGASETTTGGDSTNPYAAFASGLTPVSDMVQADNEVLPTVLGEQQAIFSGFTTSIGESMNSVIGMSGSVSQSFMQLGDTIGRAFGRVNNVLGAFVGTLAKSTMQIIGQNLRMQKSSAITTKKVVTQNMVQSKSNAITSATQSSKGFGPAAAFILPALIAGATALIVSAFSGLGGGGGSRRAMGTSVGGSISGGRSGVGGVTGFANGGIISGPTMGLVGEYPGARQNPEVIAPLNKLQSMIGNVGGRNNLNVTGEVRVDGQDLLIAIERANETAGRIYGN